MMKKIILFAGTVFLFLFHHTIQAQTAKVSGFPIVYRGHIYIKGEADGNPGMFLFDTGADHLYYDTTYYAAHDFNYREFSLISMRGVGTSPPQISPMISDTVEFIFSGHRYRTPYVPILKLKPVVGDIADGIIGMKYFHQFVMGIDFVNEYVTLYPSIDSADISSYSRVPMRETDGRLYLPLTVNVNENIEVNGDFLVDFGSGMTLDFTTYTTDRYKLVESVSPKVGFYTKYGGIQGESSRYTFRADSLRFDKYTFNDVVMNFSVDRSGALSSDEHLGLLGNGILVHFDIIIDFHNHNLYVKPNKYYASRFGVSRWGFSYVNRSQTKKTWIVTGFYKESPAEKSGLQIDDQIITVNGIAVSELEKKSRDFFSELEELELLVLRKGEIMEFKFKLQDVL